MTRTSLSHPLQIAAVSAGAGFERKGYDRHAATGVWDRDLALDLERSTKTFCIGIAVSPRRGSSQIPPLG